MATLKQRRLDYARELGRRAATFPAKSIDDIRTVFDSAVIDLTLAETYEAVISYQEQFIQDCRAISDGARASSAKFRRALSACGESPETPRARRLFDTLSQLTDDAARDIEWATNDLARFRVEGVLAAATEA